MKPAHDRRVVPGRAVVLVLGALATFAAGCKDSTAPAPPAPPPPPPPTPSMSIAVVARQGPDLGSDATGRMTVACSVTFQAIYAGPRRAAWQGGTLWWYEGPDRTKAVDSTLLSPAAIIQSTGGGPYIEARDTLLSGWDLGSYVPFSAAFEFRYQVEGETVVRSAGASMNCGPAVPSVPVLPVITDLIVTPATGEVQSSDTLSISYNATAALTLWQTGVVISGACDTTLVFNERLLPRVSRSLRLTLPAGCVSGSPFQVSAVAVDAALQLAQSRAPPLTFVDLTPPGIDPVYFLFNGGAGITDLRGEMYAGDSILVDFNASDNNAMRTVVWEVLPLGVRDSILVSGRYAPTSYIRTQPSWSGAIQLRLFSRDAAGLTSRVVTTPANALTLYPTITRPSRAVTVPGAVADVAIDTRRGMIYLLESNQARIAFVSIATLTVTRTLAMPSYCTGFDLSNSGDSLIVALPLQGALGIIDLRQATPTPTLLPIAGLDSATRQVPTLVRALSNGRAFVATEGSVASAYRLLDVDLASGATRTRTDAWTDGIFAGAFERSPDHSALVLGGAPWQQRRYDVASDAFGSIQVTNAVGGITLTTTGDRVAVGFAVFDGSLIPLTIVHSTVSAFGVVPTALSPDGTILYQVLGNGLIRSRVSDGAILDRILNPVIATAGRLSADGTLFVSVSYNYGSTSGISVIELP